MAGIVFRGGRTCSCVVKSLPWVEFHMGLLGLIKNNIDIYQLGYRTDVGASKGTHARGGCVDVEQYMSDEIEVWRWWGWTMQRRDLKGIPTHAHGWPYRCPHLSSAAQGQEDDWDRRDAGLAGTGKVVGPWPVLPWDVALERRKMAILDDVENAVVRGVVRALQRDGVLLNNGFTGNPDNTEIAVKTSMETQNQFLMNIANEVEEIKTLITGAKP